MTILIIFVYALVGTKMPNYTSRNTMRGWLQVSGSQGIKAISQGIKISRHQGIKASSFKVSGIKFSRYQGIKVSRHDLKMLPENDLDSNEEGR